jgi:hypothetical protein
MNKQYDTAKDYWTLTLPRWARIIVRGIMGLILLVVVAYIGLAWYIHSHKKEVLASVTAQLNEGLTGELTISNMETAFLSGFPRISLRLEKVVLRDSLFKNHNRTFLSAGRVDVALNTLALVRGAIEIKKIIISDAAIDMYVDSLGYSNANVFKKKAKGAKGDKASSGGSFPELRKLQLDNVTFTSDNKKNNKLYKFKIDDLTANIDFTSDGFEADVSLEGFAESMAFNTKRGSFIEHKTLDGDFSITYNDDDGFLNFAPERLDIGGERFIISARLGVGDKSQFVINIENRKILWKSAANLLSKNITDKLMMFNLSEPISVICKIDGDFNSNGDPLIEVTAKIKDNVLDTPGGPVENCNFTGIFTNEHLKGQGFTDANSAIRLYDFKGTYSQVPFVMKKAFILNLDKPIATGDFSSDFDMEKLRGLVDEDLVAFGKGTASVKVTFKADIVNYKLTKPLVSGLINVKNANITYVPRKLEFKDVSVALNFTKDDLFISKVVLKTGKSVVNMEGSIKNFLNLYYTNPDKVLLEWQMYSPQLHMGEFMAFLGSRKKAQSKIKKTSKGNITDDLNLLFEKANIDMKMKVDNLYYNNFHATNARATLLLTDNNVYIKNMGLNHAGGSLVINGSMVQGTVNNYKVDAVINNVDVSTFLTAFDNFGQQSLTGKNLKGYFSSRANISGRISDRGKMVPRSMAGNVNFNLKKGRLVDFGPVHDIGKFAFPFRDMKNIDFYDLKGNFDVRGEKVTIHPMKINSSVLNMDIEGVYSFGKGTEIYIDVPLRNPKKDKDITDKEELAKRRNRGIVVHLNAKDDKDGAVKVGLGGKD